MKLEGVQIIVQILHFFNANDLASKLPVFIYKVPCSFFTFSAVSFYYHKLIIKTIFLLRWQNMAGKTFFPSPVHLGLLVSGVYISKGQWPIASLWGSQDARH